jgi:unsaturated rhamnogalacturonyl hydrolase
VSADRPPDASAAPRDHGRRLFLMAAAATGGAAAATLAAPLDLVAAGADGGGSDADPLVPRVRTAMLAMQRRAWEQGTAAQALLEWGDVDLVVLLAKDAVVNQAKDGRLGLNGDRGPVCDPAVNGEPVLAAYRATSDPAFKAAADRMLDFLLHQAPRTRKGTLYHNHVENRVWVDAFYMAPPFLAVAGRPDEAVKQVEGLRATMRDPATGCFFHIWDEDLQRFERRLLWGVGNGWAAAGMTRVVRALPDAMKADRERIAGYVRELLDACLRFQREDSLFHDVLDDPKTFVETNAAQMFAYSIYRGVQAGWLPASHVDKAERIRAAARAKVDAFGLVQGVCGAPNFDRSGTATEGQAFFILMEAARKDGRV